MGSVDGASADWSMPSFVDSAAAGDFYYRQTFAVLLPARTVGMMGDFRTYARGHHRRRHDLRR